MPRYKVTVPEIWERVLVVAAGNEAEAIEAARRAIEAGDPTCATRELRFGRFLEGDEVEELPTW